MRDSLVSLRLHNRLFADRVDVRYALSMKSLLISTCVITSLFILTGCVGEEPEPLLNPLSAEDCPAPPAGMEIANYARGVGVVESGTSQPPQVFSTPDAYGIRCYYEEVVPDAYDITHAEGRSFGDFNILHEMELRIIPEVGPAVVYEDETLPGLIDNTYCSQTHIEGGIKEQLTTDGNAHGLWDWGSEYRGTTYINRYHCAWPARLLESGGESINTSSLINITQRHDAIITYRAVKEQGLAQFLPDDLSITGEAQTEQGRRARREVYALKKFQKPPDDHEEYFVTELFNVIELGDR